MSGSRDARVALPVVRVIRIVSADCPVCGDRTSAADPAIVGRLLVGHVADEHPDLPDALDRLWPAVTDPERTSPVTDSAAPLNPDCRAGKCGACAGDAWDETTDQPAACAHHCHQTEETTP